MNSGVGSQVSHGLAADLRTARSAEDAHALTGRAMAASPLPSAAARAEPAPLSTREFELTCYLATHGLTVEGFRHLVRLRARYRAPQAQALDGLVVNNHLRFARWLIAHGRVTDGRPDE